MKLNKKEVYKLLTDEETFGSVIFTICLFKYNTDLFEEDIMEILIRIKEDFGVDNMPEENENKLQALITAFVSPFFYEEPEVFSAVCKTLFLGDPDLAEFGMDNPTLLECLWGMYEVNLISQDGEEFGYRVINLINEIISNEILVFGEDTPNEIGLVEQIDLIFEERKEQLKEQLALAGFDVTYIPDYSDKIL